MDLRDVNAVVFDLDGTLYQEHSFYKTYISLLLEGGPRNAELGAVRDFATATLEGGTGLKMGGFLRRATPPVEAAEKLYEIRSEENAGDNFEERFFDDGYVYMGDAWSVVMAVAGLLGVEQERRSRAFAEIRRRMVEDRTLIVSERVKVELKALGDRGVQLYLFTNTHEAAAIDFVRQIGLSALIPTIEFGIEKPYGLRERLPRIAEKAGGVEKVLSVGDHGFNDLSPAKAIGAKTALISPYAIHDGIEWSRRLRTLDQLAELLSQVHTRQVFTV